METEPKYLDSFFFVLLNLEGEQPRDPCRPGNELSEHVQELCLEKHPRSAWETCLSCGDAARLRAQVTKWELEALEIRSIISYCKSFFRYVPCLGISQARVLSLAAKAQDDNLSLVHVMKKKDENHLNVFCGGKRCSQHCTLFTNANHRVIQGFGDEGNGALTWCTRRSGEVCASSMESLCTSGTRPEPTTKARG